MKRDHHIFFAGRVTGDLVFLDSSEAHHARSVLRLGEGDEFQATDGAGWLYRCTVRAVAPSSIEGLIVSREQRDRPVPRVRCFVGMPDRDALDTALELLTPLGISSLVPMQCEYCQKPWWNNNWEKHAERFERKAIAGMKQALLVWRPEVRAPIPFREALDAAPRRIIVAHDQGTPVLRALADPPREVSCFIGPPGGFSPGELDLLRARDALFVRISPNRLRTELAACVLVGALMQIAL